MPSNNFMQNYRIELIDSTASFRLKKEEWLKLENSIEDVQIFNSYEFLYNFWEVFEKLNDHKFGYKKELKILFLYQDDKLKAIMPLTLIWRKRKKIIGVKYLEFLGQQFFTSYMDIISVNITNEEFLFLMKWINENISYDLFNLELLTEKSIFKKYCKNKNLYAYNYSPEIDIKEFTSYENFKLNHISSNYRRVINNSYNKLKTDNIRCDVVWKKFEERDLDLLNSLSESKLKDGKYNIYDDVQKKEFVRRIYTVFNADVSYIKFNDVYASYQIYIYYRDQSMWFDISFDRDFGKYRPGILQYDIGLKNSFEKRHLRNILGYGYDQNKVGISNRLYKLYNFVQKGNGLFSSVWYKEKITAASASEKFILENSIKQ